MPKKVGFLKNAVEGARDLFELPFDLFDEIATRFRGSRIDNSKILSKYRAHALKESQIKALQGIYEDSAKYVQKLTKIPYLKSITMRVIVMNFALQPAIV